MYVISNVTKKVLFYLKTSVQPDTKLYAINVPIDIISTNWFMLKIKDRVAAKRPVEMHANIGVFSLGTT